MIQSRIATISGPPEISPNSAMTKALNSSDGQYRDGIRKDVASDVMVRGALATRSSSIGSGRLTETRAL